MRGCIAVDGHVHLHECFSIEGFFDAALENFQRSENGGRLAAWRAPALFARAREKRFWRLAGTDPLPFPRQVGRVGRYGSLLPYTVDPDRPGTSLVRCLRQLTADPPVYGDLERIASFVVNQSRMQLRKRMARRFE